MSVVLISGGTGLVGAKLTRHLLDRKYEVIVLTRQKNKTSEKHPNLTYSYWNHEEGIIDPEVIKKSDHIIHLAGAGVMDKKWTEAYKKLILTSRTQSASFLIKCVSENTNQVKTFVSASAIGYYGGDKGLLPRPEGFIETDLPGKDFLAETCLLWEAASDPVTALGIRLVKLRSGIVLSNEGGAFKEFRAPLRFGIAPVFGSGRQIISWIHIDDLCRMYCEAIENNFMNGVYNAVAPQPVPQKKFINKLGEVIRNKFYSTLYAPSFILKIALGDRSIEILKSATISCKKILATGFTFLYPTTTSAFEALKDKNK